MENNLIEEYQRKVELLDEYSKALEKENFAKNQETQIIYHQLESFQQENQMLKSMINTMKSQRDSQLLRTSLTQPTILRKSNHHFAEALRQSSTIESYKQIADKMKEELALKDDQLEKFASQNQQLSEILSYLEAEMEKAKQKVEQSEDKTRRYLRKIKNLQQKNYQLRQTIQSTNSISFHKLESEKLVKQNNALIEKVRMLEKEKNIYYSQLRAISPVKQADHSKLDISRKKSDKKKWGIIQEKLKFIRQENQQLKANLSIK